MFESGKVEGSLVFLFEGIGKNLLDDWSAAGERKCDKEIGSRRVIPQYDQSPIVRAEEMANPLLWRRRGGLQSHLVEA